MSRLQAIPVLAIMLLFSQPALARGSLEWDEYFCMFPAAVLVSWLAARCAPTVKESFFRTVLPSISDQPEPEFLAQVKKREWIAASIAYTVAMGPGQGTIGYLIDIGSREGLVLYALALFMVIHVAIVFRTNKSLGSFLGKDYWRSLSGIQTAGYSLLLSIVTPCLFIVLWAAFACVLKFSIW